MVDGTCHIELLCRVTGPLDQPNCYRPRWITLQVTSIPLQASHSSPWLDFRLKPSNLDMDVEGPGTLDLRTF